MILLFYISEKKAIRREILHALQPSTILYTLPSFLVQGLCSHVRWWLYLQWITSTLHSKNQFWNCFLSNSINFFLYFLCPISIHTCYNNFSFQKEVPLYDFALKRLSPSHSSALHIVKLLNKIPCTCFRFLISHSLINPLGSHYSTDIALSITSTLSYLVIIFSRSILIHLSAAF